MAKTRKRKSKPVPPVTPTIPTERVGTVELTRYEVPTIELVQINNIAQVEELAVAGCIVKLSPTVKASEKDAFDGPLHVARLRERGALTVVLAPRTVIDTVTKRDEIASSNPRDLVDAWFADQTAVDPRVIEASKELVLATMESEGI